MSKEYHDEFMHVIIDCKTGNESADQGIENAILGYVYLVVDCLEKGRFDELVTKSKNMAVEFSKKNKKE